MIFFRKKKQVLSFGYLYKGKSPIKWGLFMFEATVLSWLNVLGDSFPKNYKMTPPLLFGESGLAA